MEFLHDLKLFGVASKFGYGSARGDPDVWIGLDHLRFGMDRGYGSPVGLGYGSGLYILTCSHFAAEETLKNWALTLVTEPIPIGPGQSELKHTDVNFRGIDASLRRVNTENVITYMTPCPPSHFDPLRKTTLTLQPPLNHHREIRLLRWSPALGRNCTHMCNLELLSLQE